MAHQKPSKAPSSWNHLLPVVFLRAWLCYSFGSEWGNIFLLYWVVRTLRRGPRAPLPPGGRAMISPLYLRGYGGVDPLDRLPPVQRYLLAVAVNAVVATL